MNTVSRVARRLRYGHPIVVVSGLPRSGTSVAMRMLEAGGVPLLVDGLRSADISNPHGYYEYEPVKDLENSGDAPWLKDARGKAVKIISFLLTWLPEDYDYRVIFMRRNLDEVLRSQNTMLDHRGEGVNAAADQQVRDVYESHLARVDQFLRRRACFSVLSLEYSTLVADPAESAARITDLVGRPLAVERMAAAVDPALYRNRKAHATAL